MVALVTTANTVVELKAAFLAVAAGGPGFGGEGPCAGPTGDA